jgi:hypothetical protein
MPRLARLALMFVLAIALPLQGMAAATMISCGLGEHEHDHAHAVSHDHHGSAGHAHATEASSHDTPVAHSHDGKADLPKGALHKCSACASCCVGAAVPSQAIAFDTVKLTDRFAPLVARSVPAYVSEGLERPPRAFLA